MAKEKDPKNKKHFFKDFKAELKKVIWPTPKQVVNNTIAVVVIVIITAAIVFVLDLAFEMLNKHGVDKIKEKVRTETVVENVTSEDGANENTIENEVETEEKTETPENSAE